MRRTAALPILVTLLLVWSPNAHASGRIAVGVSGPGRIGLYVVRADGTGSRQLADPQHAAYQPDWSPDGRWIAYNSEGDDGEDGTFKVRRDGTGRRRLSVAPCYDEFDPDWSPNGDRLVFRHDTCESAHVLVMNKHGHARHRVSHRNAGSPEWSPAAPLIAFNGRDSHRHEQIFLVRPDGSRERQLTEGEGLHTRFLSGNFDPHFSPDGRWVAYYGGAGRSSVARSRICIIRTDGAHEHCLTDGGHDLHPRFSPDGRWIAFVRRPHGETSDIFIVRVDGSRLTRLTSGNGADYSPEWSPNGRRIAFLSSRSGNVELHVMRRDGAHVQRLTRTEGKESAPAWAPA